MGKCTCSIDIRSLGRRRLGALCNALPLRAAWWATVAARSSEFGLFWVRMRWGHGHPLAASGSLYALGVVAHLCTCSAAYFTSVRCALLRAGWRSLHAFVSPTAYFIAVQPCVRGCRAAKRRVRLPAGLRFEGACFCEGS